MADMVALLRAFGGHSAEDVAGALGLSERTVDALSLEGDGTMKHWTAEGAAREVRRFREREGRWPTSTDFRTQRHRTLGLPSWDGLTVLMLGIPRRHWLAVGNEPWLNRRRREGMTQHGVDLPDGVVPQNGWVGLQWYMAHWCEVLSLTHEELLTLPNATARRHGMERRGIDRLCAEAGESLDEHPHFGRLWRFPGTRQGTTLRADREDMLFVEVVNSTPEPDGSRARYFLRVPPDMDSAHRAVAWTFGVTDGWEEFDVEVET